MKRRGGARRERFSFAAIEPFPGVCALRGGDFVGLRVSGAAAPERSRQIYPLVALPVSGRGHRHRLGDVSVLSLNNFANTLPRNELTVIFSGCYRHEVGRGSSVVEQPIRNRQVVGSTPTLGSRFPVTSSRSIS